MTDNLSIALAQLDPLVGDVHGNLDRARNAAAEAGKMGADLVIFSEMFVSGYPPEDRVLKPAVMTAVAEGV